MIPSPSLFLLFSLAFTSTTTALPWTGPKPTSTYLADEWTPRPTHTSSDTAAELLKKSSVPAEVCGWNGADFASPVVCGSGSSCVHDTAHAVVGCCTTAGSCSSGVYTACLDYKSADRVMAGREGVLSCAGSSVCNQNTYPGGYHQFQCGASSSTATIATMYSGQPSDFLLRVVYTGLSYSQDSESATATSNNTSSSTSTPAVSPSGSSVSSSTDVSVSTTQDGSHRVRNIVVGSVIGGISGLVALIGLLYFFIRNRREAAAQSHHVGPFVSKYESTLFNPEDFNGRGDDFVTPMAMSGSSYPPHPAIFPAAYRTLSHKTRLNTNVARVNSPPQESTPLFSEIDDFSRTWNEAMQLAHTSSYTSSQDPVIQQDPRPLIGKPDILPTTNGVRVHEGVGLRGGDGSNQRSPGRSRWIRTPTNRENVRREGWSPAPLRPRTPSPPPRNPRRLSNQHSGRPSRYQPVDGSPPASTSSVESEYEDVPILDSPTGLMKGIGRAC